MWGILVLVVVYLWMKLNKLKAELDIQDNKILALHKRLSLLQHKLDLDITSEAEKELKILAEKDLSISNKTATEPKTTIKKEFDLKDEKLIHRNRQNDFKEKIKSISLFKKEFFSVESIITKVGILLLLISVGFIFKLAYDNGYVTEKLALLFGVIIGFILEGIGLRVRIKGRMILSQVLFGGGIATLFITTYAAYQGYGLISGMLAFSLMTIITFAAFVIAVSMDSVAMSIIGIVGGLLTPFIVELDYIGLFGLGLYITALALGSMVIYLYKKWRSLQLSAIFGILLVTGYLATLSGFSVKETYQLSGLIVFLLVLFNGIDYTLYYIEKEALLGEWISPALFAFLPLISLIQLDMILDLSNDVVSFIYALAALIYAALTVVLYKKKGHTIVSNITLSFVAFFFTFSLLLYFDGNIRYMTVIIMSLMFYLIAYKTKNPFAGIIGHSLYAFGFLIALIGLILDAVGGPASVMDVISRLIIVSLLTVGVFIQKKPIRYVFGVMVYEVYAIVLMHVLIWQWAKESEPLAIMILAYGLWLWILLLFSKKLSFVPTLSILLIGMLPMFLKGVFSILALIKWELNGFEVTSLIVYAVSFYLLANYQFKDIKAPFRMSAKLNSFIIISLTCLIDVWILTDHFGYSLLSYGVLILLINKFETERNKKMMIISLLVMKVMWMIFGLYYVIYGIDNASFELIPFISDMLILVVLYLMLRTFKLKGRYQLIINAVIYMIIIYQNFQYAENGSGTITLLWAAYAIGGLTYSVVKAKRDMVNISLLMIVVIAIKFVIIDISTVSILWKIITSMAFGIALLILSYVLQPILAKNESMLKRQQN